MQIIMHTVHTFYLNLYMIQLKSSFWDMYFNTGNPVWFKEFQGIFHAKGLFKIVHITLCWGKKTSLWHLKNITCRRKKVTFLLSRMKFKAPFLSCPSCFAKQIFFSITQWKILQDGSWHLMSNGNTGCGVFKRGVQN